MLSTETGMKLIEGSSTAINSLTMAINYAIQAVLSFQISSGMIFFTKFLPTEVPNLNCCARLYGGLVRFFMNI